jgi:hypothetical protein
MRSRWEPGVLAAIVLTTVLAAAGCGDDPGSQVVLA